MCDCCQRSPADEKQATAQEQLTSLQTSVDTLTKELEAEKAKSAELTLKADAQPQNVTTFDPEAVQAEVERRLASMSVPAVTGAEEDEEAVKKRQEEVQASIAKERERAIEE